MKSFLIAASCLALILPSLTAAQGGSDQRGRPGGDQSQRPGGGGKPDRPGGGGGGGMPGRPNPGRPNPGRPGGGGPPPRPTPGRPTPGRPTPGRPHRPGHGHRPGVRPPGRPGFGWNGHRYRAGAYRYPTGYGYRRWSRGQILPLLFLSATYYFTNYAVLGLDPPPYGYQWVRYGPDVLLVNIRTGEVMDVEYGVFY